EADQKSIGGVAVGSIDASLGSDDAEGGGVLVRRTGNERAVLRPGKRDGVRAAEREVEPASRRRQPGDDPPALEQDDVIVLLQARPGLEPARERCVEWD